MIFHELPVSDPDPRIASCPEVLCLAHSHAHTNTRMHKCRQKQVHADTQCTCGNTHTCTHKDTHKHIQAHEHIQAHIYAQHTWGQAHTNTAHRDTHSYSTHGASPDTQKQNTYRNGHTHICTDMCTHTQHTGAHAHIDTHGPSKHEDSPRYAKTHSRMHSMHSSSGMQAHAHTGTDTQCPLAGCGTVGGQDVRKSWK